MAEETPDIDLEERNDDGELYEHYRITVDKGQAMLRIDKGRRGTRYKTPPKRSAYSSAESL